MFGYRNENEIRNLGLKSDIEQREIFYIWQG